MMDEQEYSCPVGGCSHCNECGPLRGQENAHEHADSNDNLHERPVSQGHEHEHGGGLSFLDLARLATGALLFGLSFLPALAPAAPWMLASAAIIAGAETLFEGAKSLLRLRADETLLMSIAVVAAFAIGEYSEGALVAILFSVGEKLEDIALERSRRSLRALTDIRPDSANVFSADGETSVIRAEDVAIGSELLVKVGERVPLDSVLISRTASLDFSALTGESLPRTIEKGGELLSGAVVLESPLRCKTVNGYRDSAASRIIELVENSSKQKGRTEKFITRFAAIYTPAVIAAAAALAILPALAGALPFEQSLHRALVFLVASCPCALVISVPLAFFAGAGAASRQGVLIKGSEYIERLAHAQNAVFDKTGTLTGGKLSVSEVLALDDLSSDEILLLAAAAEKLSDHPIARAVLNAWENSPLAAGGLPETAESEEGAGYGIRLQIGGKELLCGSKKLLERHSVSTEGAPDASLYIAQGGVLKGAILLEDAPRRDAAPTLEKLARLGFSRLVMLTGDNPRAAQIAAQECGIDEFEAGLLPEDKVERVLKIKQSGSTLFVGDGINDAPVLAAADIGVAMGFGTDAAIEAADVVLMSGELSALPHAVAIARRTAAQVKINVAFALGVKALVLGLGLFGMAPVWLAVFADVGVTMITVLMSISLLRTKK